MRKKQSKTNPISAYGTHAQQRKDRERGGRELAKAMPCFTYLIYNANSNSRKKAARLRASALSLFVLSVVAAVCLCAKEGRKEWDGAGHKSRIRRRTGRRKNAPAIAAKMRETTTARQSEQKGSSKQRHKKQRTGGGEGRSGAEVGGRKNEMKFTFINHSCALQTERNE